MKTILRGLRPSPALVIACLALFLAMGGVGYAALKLKPNSVRTRNIKDAAVTESKIAGGAVSTGKLAANAKSPLAGTADNALQLGGASPSAFQGFCKAGSIKASLVINTTGLPVSPNFTNEPGFNCFQPGNLTSSVQIRHAALGTYIVRFVGNSGPNNSGSAVISNLDTGYSVAFAGTDLGAPGEVTFTVNTHNDNGTLGENHTFSLLAF
jgi:hypothetical protein